MVLATATGHLSQFCLQFSERQRQPLFCLCHTPNNPSDLVLKLSYSNWTCPPSLLLGQTQSPSLLFLLILLAFLNFSPLLFWLPFLSRRLVINRDSSTPFQREEVSLSHSTAQPQQKQALPNSLLKSHDSLLESPTQSLWDFH